QSKSHLISAIHQVIEPRQKIYYFPAYEIMMDEMRDYRFYAEDLLHPNKTAINYIWEYFKTAWISDEADTTMQEVDAIQKAMKHKPFNPESEEYKALLAQLDERINNLKANFSHIIF
ncbi:MAG: GSCFA domain-containing protein, partial [Melioribacteraceae bacterium]|nr:GSCFA domain-containing protein [Melioribacteraceae bacterium]